MLTPTLNCFRCRFTVDLHVNPTRAFIATFQLNQPKSGRTTAGGDLHVTASNSASSRAAAAAYSERVDTYGAAWPAGRPSKAVVFEVAKYEDFPSSPLESEPLEFLVSRQFVIDFGFDTAKEYIFKELENCPALQLVVLRGPRHLLEEAQSRQWQNRWCETLVHRGSDLGGLTVTDTRPTRFGVVTINTQMIILEGGMQVKSTLEAAPTSFNPDNLILRPLLTLPSRLYQTIRLMAKDAADTTDPDRCVFLSDGSLSKLGLRPFSWAQVEVNNVKRIVRAVPSAVIQNQLADGILLASPQLLLNLSDSQEEVTCTLHAVENYPTQNAIEMSVAIIKSPRYNHQADFSALLKYHFDKQPRLLSKGDVIAISQKEFFDYSPDLRATCSYRNEVVVYFRVGSIAGGDQGEPESLWCDSQTCTLYQSGATVSKVPRCMELMLDATYDPVFNTPTCVYPDVEELLEMMKLFHLKHQMAKTLQPFFLISGSPNSGKNTAVQSMATTLGLHLYEVQGYELTGDTPAVAETRIRNSLEKALSFGPCIVHVVHVEDIFRHILDPADTRLITVFLEALTSLNRCPGQTDPVMIVATSCEPNKIPSQVMSTVLHHLSVPPMKQEDRRRILELLLNDDTVSLSLDLDKVAEKAAGFVLGDLAALVEFARKNLYSRDTDGPSMVGMGCGLATPILTMEDFSAAINQIQKNHSKSIGAPEIPSVRWDDIGGLETAKKEILNTIQFPLKNPNFGASGNTLSRSGILLYGPPGTGKTLLAKAVATECSLNFLSVKGPELINMYIGQSEDNVRKVFEKARSAAPCVIFFDELDSLAPRRGRSGDSGGVMDRVVSQLLAEMDGLGKGGVDGGQVFVIGATNRPDLLDSAILRPGRLDRLVYVDIPEEIEVKYKVLKALTRKLNLRDVDLHKLSEACPLNLTGADLYSLCASAMVNAVRRCIDTNSNKLVVIGADFEVALENLTPSVSTAELKKYRALRDKFAR